MKDKLKYIMLLIVLLVFMALYMPPSIRLYARNATIRQQQGKLAEELEVKIQDYPYESSFPIGYFVSALQPGMTLNEVHAIVKGYKEIYQCFGFAELYYYYSSDEEESIAFMISYDENKKFVDLRGIDYASAPSHSSEGEPVACSPGLLSE
jgi:hypothetical protein